MKAIFVILYFAFSANAFSQLFSDEDCGVTSNTFCLNERQYFDCDTANPENARVFTCPLGDQFCADVVGTCTSDPEVSKTERTVCDVCSFPTGTSHACTSHNTFTKCQDGVISWTDLQQCAPGTYCDVHSGTSTNPCKPFSGKELLCWRELAAEPVVPDEEICAKNGEGKYPVPNDTTCRTFIACEFDTAAKIWNTGRVYCMPPFVFWPEAQTCVPSSFYRCPSAPPTTTTTTVDTPTVAGRNLFLE